MADETIVITKNSLGAFSLMVAQTLFSLRDLPRSTAQVAFLRSKLDEYLQPAAPTGAPSPLSNTDRKALEQLYAVLEKAIQMVALREGVPAPTKSVH